MTPPLKAYLKRKWYRVQGVGALRPTHVPKQKGSSSTKIPKEEHHRSKDPPTLLFNVSEDTFRRDYGRGYSRVEKHHKSS